MGGVWRDRCTDTSFVSGEGDSGTESLFCPTALSPAIDLMDEAAAQLRLQQESKPESMEKLVRALRGARRNHSIHSEAPNGHPP